MSQPLVTVVCLCYNHGRFVKEAIESVLNQTYSNVELIVVDDASTDNSREVITKTIEGHPRVAFIPLDKNQGNCRAFNKGWRMAKGEFVIDLAADDVLLPVRIERGVREFLSNDNRVGVQFSDAEIIDETGGHLGFHSDRFPHNNIPKGDIYKELIKKYFICSPTMMFKKSVLDQLGGYDEQLAYEDFDFWIRSARSFHYVYIPEVLVKRRIVKNSLSQRQFRRSSIQQASTFTVCQKILELNQNESERKALNARIFYEFQHALRKADFYLAVRYIGLWVRNLTSTTG
jgi:glycosyltransferase involved in cell wall biosynthesis